jgi:iron complex transport system substrate-binding protein
MGAGNLRGVRNLVHAAILAASIQAATHANAAPIPSRIVSINLCTDELLIALADPGQIAGLSSYATEAGLTAFADRAKAFRHDADRGETVVAIAPDLVIGGPFSRLTTRDLVKRLGYRFVDVPPARDIAETVAQIRTVADLVGHPERGVKLIADIAAAQGRAAASAVAGRKRPTAVFYQRRGYVNGGETLTGELLRTVGIEDAGPGFAGIAGGFVPLERLVERRPEYLVVADAGVRSEDQGSALLAHPALTDLYPPERRIVLPERFTVCGGPSLPAPLDWRAAEARRVAGPRSD